MKRHRRLVIEQWAGITILYLKYLFTHAANACGGEQHTATGMVQLSLICKTGGCTATVMASVFCQCCLFDGLLSALYNSF